MPQLLGHGPAGHLRGRGDILLQVGDKSVAADVSKQPSLSGLVHFYKSCQEMVSIYIPGASEPVVVRKCGSVTGSKCLESTIPSNEVFISAWVRLVY